MVEDECGDAYGAGEEVVTLWEKGEGCMSGGWGAGGRVTHHCLPQPPEARAMAGVCSWR
jgi:hypothetical protein